MHTCTKQWCKWEAASFEITDWSSQNDSNNISANVQKRSKKLHLIRFGADEWVSSATLARLVEPKRAQITRLELRG